MSLTAEELDRYARHIVLREIGGPGQRRLRAAHVAMVGAGGLGAPALLYLAAAGVGRITLIDDDVVSRSNLQRQVIFAEADIGALKVEAAAAALGRLNPGVVVEPKAARLDASNADALLTGADLILDGCDGFDTRRIVNAEAVRTRTPLVSGALGQWEGQLSIFAPWEEGPCYACLFPEDPAPGLAPTCAEAGVVGALAGVMGALMAAEAVKRIAKAGDPLVGRLLLFDALAAEFRNIEVARSPGCPVCGGL